MRFPLRLICPADKTDWTQSIQTERELQIIKDVASRLGLAININEEQGKVYLGRSRNPTPTNVATVDISGRVRPLQQTLGDTCGRTSVAMAVNCLTGSHLRDLDVGVGGLFPELVRLCPGHRWKDEGNMSASGDLWDEIAGSLSAGCPVVIGLNGQFSSTGRGHIVLITGLGLNGAVRYADPNGGVFRSTTREAIERCASHPDGKFVFTARPR